jgi:hypothetical protein
MSGPVGHSGEGDELGISPAGGGPDNAIARWDGTASIQGSGVILDDANNSTGWLTVRINPAGWLQVGDDPGGPTPAAQSGAIRLWSGADIIKDDGAGNDIAIWTSGATGGVLGSNVPALRPFFLGMDVSNNFGLSLNGFAEIFCDPSGLYLGWQTPFTEIGNDVLRYWFASAGPYELGPDADPTAAITGKLFETYGQDAPGAGATVGGARLDRAGDTTSPPGVGGDYDNRAGEGNSGGGRYTISRATPGVFDPMIEVTDQGAGLLGEAHIHETIVDATPYNVGPDDLCILVDTSLGVAITVNLPNASAFPGRLLWVVDDKGQAPASLVTIARSAPDTINGANQYLMRVAWEAILLKASNSGNNWRILARYP